MNYITACPACETQFLINTEHLKAYRGKVQCGNCNHVFNAKNRLTEVSDDILSVEEYSVAENAPENIAAEADSTEHDLSQHDLNIQVTEEYTNTESAADSETESNPTFT